MGAPAAPLTPHLMDQSDLDKAYSCAKGADAATLSGEFVRASRVHLEAAAFFQKAATAAPENSAVRVLEALAKQHRSRAAYLASGKVRQASSSQTSPASSPMASVRHTPRAEPLEDLVGRATQNILKSLEGALARESSDSFYLVDDPEVMKRSIKAMIQHEMTGLTRELKERERERPMR